MAMNGIAAYPIEGHSGWGDTAVVILGPPNGDFAAEGPLLRQVFDLSPMAPRRISMGSHLDLVISI